MKNPNGGSNRPPPRTELREAYDRPADIANLTERKRAEKALRTSEVLVRAMFESESIGMMLVDAAGHTLEVNGYVAAMLGYSQDELLARTFSEITHPEDVEKNATLFRQAIEGTIDSYCLEKRFIHRDGRHVWAVVSAAVVRDAAGRPLYFIGHVEDITTRKQLEREREEQTAQLDRIFEAISDGLVVFDAQGHLTRMNLAAKRIFGIESMSADYSVLADSENRAARHVVRDLSGRRRDQNDWLVNRILDGGPVMDPPGVEFQMKTPDGHELQFTTTVTPIYDTQGSLIGAVSVLHDTTERNRLEREREEARGGELDARAVALQLDEFFAMASHDIRSPVTALSGNVQLASVRARRLEAALKARGADEVALASPLMVALDHTHESLQHLLRLVSLLFDMARARTGTLALTLARLDLAALVQESVAAQRAAAPGRTILLNLPDQPVPVEADADRLAQVLTNYLSNALKYSSDDQLVTVGLEVTAGIAVVSVKDHGPGLPWEEQARIWELYHRAPGVEVRSEQNAGASLGLGLHICKRLIELHPGGRVGVESVLGSGATFWFRLPVANVPPGEFPSSASGSQGGDQEDQRTHEHGA